LEPEFSVKTNFHQFSPEKYDFNLYKEFFIGK
jgi:hypothetical protein